MSIFKCKMCGGTLEINNETVATCEYCGTKQTLPRLADDRRANLYDRANHFRRNNEFDKAMGIYEQILNEDSTDAESYWSLVLCRYGIEYVEDPGTHKRVPTVNRAQFTSIFDDDNYKSALQYADAAQRRIYEEEARAINEIQKGILVISQKEDPFDVFICYKETDQSGRRTPDSVLANDLYHQLTQEGFKVFFARITLEDKLGVAYEPYIFAALNSAKVMVVLGTRPEYFNAVWVKNEWSRYLALIRNGAKKILIPAYKDMDPYDLPEEFSHLQAQDMSKLGFMQDLIRGIKKIAQTDEPKAAVVKETVVTAGASNTATLLKRVFMFLEDGDWAAADEYCEKVLDIDPECAEAYLGKLMAELKVRKQEALKDCAEPFDGNGSYQKAIRFSGQELRDALVGHVEHIKERNELKRAGRVYGDARKKMGGAKSEAEFLALAKEFESIAGFKDAREFAEHCLELAENVRKDRVQLSGKLLMDEGQIVSYQRAIETLWPIRGWKDTEKLIERCQQKIEELKEKEEQDRKNAEARAKRRNKVILVVLAILGAISVFLVILIAFIIPEQKKKDFIATYGQDVYDRFGFVAEGKYITFGEYEQDNDISNGKEKVEWLVLEVTNGRALVISKYALNYMNIGGSWEGSYHRELLNDTYFNSMFSAEEKKMIPVVSIFTEGEGETQDRIFLLSASEAEKYREGGVSLACEPTAYAVAQGATREGTRGNCDWWLRTKGKKEHVIVDSKGKVDRSVWKIGEYWDDEKGEYVRGGAVPSIRPAMWIDLNA